MLARIHCLFPQALVFVLVIATFMRLKALRGARRPRRVGTMLWVYLFAVTLELSYSACLLGTVQCDVVTWYVFCVVFAALGLVVLKRDDVIDATLTQMVTDEQGLALATERHRRTSAVAVAMASVATALGVVVPHLMLDVPGGLSVAMPLLAGAIVLPAIFMFLSRGGGLASSLVAIILVAIAVVQASVLAEGGTFSLASDVGPLVSSFIRGQTPLALSRPALISLMLAGVAVALCSLLFRLPAVVPAEPADDADDAIEPSEGDDDVALLPDDTAEATPDEESVPTEGELPR